MLLNKLTISIVLVAMSLIAIPKTAAEGQLASVQPRLRTILREHAGRAHCLAFSADGKMLEGLLEA